MPIAFTKRADMTAFARADEGAIATVLHGVVILSTAQEELAILRRIWRVMKRLTLLAAGLLAFTGIASADDGPVTMRGLGLASCNQYLAVRKEQGITPNKAVYNQWAQGFMTGLNVALYMKFKKYVDLPDAMP